MGSADKNWPRHLWSPTFRHSTPCWYRSGHYRNRYPSLRQGSTGWHSQGLPRSSSARWRDVQVGQPASPTSSFISCTQMWRTPCLYSTSYLAPTPSTISVIFLYPLCYGTSRYLRGDGDSSPVLCAERGEVTEPLGCFIWKVMQPVLLF